MSDEQNEAPEAENEQEASQNEPQVAAPAPEAAQDTSAYVIRVRHTDSGFVGPFIGRQAAETYLEAKRSRDEEGRWAPGNVEIVSASAAHAEKEEAAARALLGR